MTLENMEKIFLFRIVTNRSNFWELKQKISSSFASQPGPKSVLSNGSVWTRWERTDRTGIAITVWRRIGAVERRLEQHGWVDTAPALLVRTPRWAAIVGSMANSVSVILNLAEFEFSGPILSLICSKLLSGEFGSLEIIKVRSLWWRLKTSV